MDQKKLAQETDHSLAENLVKHQSASKKENEMQLESSGFKQHATNPTDFISMKPELQVIISKREMLERKLSSTT